MKAHFCRPNAVGTGVAIGEASANCGNRNHTKGNNRHEGIDICRFPSAMGEGVFAGRQDDAIGGNVRSAMKADENLMQEI